MVMSRTDGAPTLPILSEEEAALRELQRQLLDGEIDRPTYEERIIALRNRTRGTPEASPPPEMTVDEQIRQNGLDYRELERDHRDGRISTEEFSRRLSELRLPDRPPPSSTDGMPGPMTGTEEDYQAFAGITPDPLEPMRQEGRDMQNARDYGRRVGGGAPFTSEGEAQQYNQRPNLSEEQKAAMLAAGATEGEIIDAQRSQYDRDMAQVGITGGTGWVPVYGPSGTVTYMERAPVPGDGMGATDKAVGGARRVGPSVDNREVKPGLDRPDLEARGYESTPIDGPYGKEYVYKATKISADMRARMKEDYGFTDAEIDALEAGGNRGTTAYQLATRAIKDRRQKENMAARAGVSQAQGAGMNRMQLRQLIRENREAELAQRREVNQRSRMASRPRNELGLQQLSDPNVSDWEKAALFAQITDDVRGVNNMNPLARDAQSMQNLMRMMNMEALGGANSPMEQMRQQAALAAMTGEDAVRMSQQRGEKMGEGMSGGHVMDRYRYWLLDPGPSSPERREREFRREMERLNYSSAQIDEFLDAQRAAGNVRPPLPPEATDPSMLPPM